VITVCIVAVSGSVAGATEPVYGGERLFVSTNLLLLLPPMAAQFHIRVLTQFNEID
jgi:hypothetical protein